MKRFLTLIFLIIPLFVSQGKAVKAYSNLEEQARLYRTEGYKLQSMGDLDGALKYYQKAVELDPKYHEIYNDLGVLYETMGDDEKALMMYLKTLEVDKGYLPVYTNLAFYYEKKGQVKKASYYWTKRYDMGIDGDYWKEVARQHLLALGTYPQLKKEILEEKALVLSKELAVKREQARLKANEEAKLHFDIASSLFFKGDYKACMKELDTLSTFEFEDDEIKKKAANLYKKARKAIAKALALAAAKEAVNYIEAEDYLSAGEKLKSALSAVFRIAQD